MLKKFGLGLLILIIGILGVAATRPGESHFQRTATIHATPDKIYPLIADFHRWTAWSPYETLDPAMKRTYTGAESGLGATYAWEGNSKAGAGKMEIVEASTPSKVGIKLDFTKPLATHNVADFTLVPHGDSTDVTWAMRGPTPYVAKVMGIFVNMDRLVGDQFATGLQNLKTAAEK
ncbi:MAG TPA: SRPBCC family protein [Gemmatimonadaceae bacterium]|nr:SRPBCC family protein [Gemmatimonadaceae bacterium]